MKTFCVRLAAVSAAACTSAYAVDSAPGPQRAAGPALVRSPYDVELIGADGRPLATYQNGGRFYVLGQAGERYAIRVTNPTARRVEALISVDGLDVIDGESADFVDKRGYVVPAGGDLVVDGFRMSATQVAAFRFSSVDDSYAERKGKGRNVGVIGVAIFEEREEPHLVLPQAPPPELVPAPETWYGDDRAKAKGVRDAGAPASGALGGSAGAGALPQRSAPPADSARESAAQAGPAGPAPSSPAPRMDGDLTRGGELCCGRLGAKKQSRPGLGTQWGEERYSAVDFTSFERADRTVPSAMAELRYNDADGLRALGIQLQPAPDADELSRRETAQPFPASRGFATPPP